MSYADKVVAITSNANSFAASLADNMGIVFVAVLIIVTLGVCVTSGIKNGAILYLVAILITMIGVIIGAVSSTLLVYMIIPALILVVIGVILNQGGSE